MQITSMKQTLCDVRFSLEGNDYTQFHRITSYVSVANKKTKNLLYIFGV